MNGSDRREAPRLGAPYMSGEEAEEQGLVWARRPGEEPPPPVWKNRLLVPEKWVEDAIAGAVAEHQDDIVEAVIKELRARMEELRQE